MPYKSGRKISTQIYSGKRQKRQSFKRRQRAEVIYRKRGRAASEEKELNDMDIIDAIKDRALFRKFLQDKDGKLHSWRAWSVALKVLYGLPIKNNSYNRELILKCTGRDLSSFTPDGIGFKEAHFIVGRRSGKSRIASIIGAYSACFEGKEELLHPGEQMLVSVCSPTKRQSLVVKKYLRAIFQQTPLLEQEVVRDTSDSFELRNGICIEVLIGSGKSVRGFSVGTSIVDELAFFGLEDFGTNQAKNDTELLRAIKPSLITLDGRLICITSPYARRGYTYRVYKKHWGVADSKVLVWNCDSQTMNSTLPDEIIKAAMENDLQSAKNEWLGEFRDDIGLWLPIEVIQACVIKGRKELMPNKNISYASFTDISGGRNDDAALCIGHHSLRAGHDEAEKVIVDAIYRFPAPHNPHLVVESMCQKLRQYGIKRTVGDNYSAEWVKSSFEKQGIRYERCPLNKSQLYIEFIGRICSKRVELLDNPLLIGQLASLERRTRQFGRDAVDHPTGGKDDMSNAVAGLAYVSTKGRKIVGALW